MLLEYQAIEKLTAGEFSFEPLRVSSVEAQVQGSEVRPDWLLELQWNGQTERFAVEYKSLATPKRLEEAIGLARRWTREKVWPMVMASYLAPEALDRLVDERVSGLDFSGNGVVVVPQRWFVYRTGMPNRYPANQYIKAIYAGRSSLVGRALLLRGDYRSVKEVREEIEARGGTISLATVSKVLQVLEEDLIVSRQEGIRVLQPDRLLDNLAADYSPPDAVQRIRGQVPDRGLVLEKVLARAEAQQTRIAAKGESVFALYPGAEKTLTIYCESSVGLFSDLGIEESARFWNLEVLETRDERVYFDRRWRDGFVWTSPLEVYLSLVKGDKRDQEVAAQLRSDLLERRLS